MRAVRRSKRHDDLVRQLAEAPHPLLRRSIFPTMRELMCFAAVLGFECNRRAALDSTTSEIDGRIFEQDAARDLVLLIALAEQRDAQLLREERLDECVHIFEEYAEVGLQELASWLRESPEDPHGDRAILTALAKRGYLETRVEAARVAGDVEF